MIAAWEAEHQRREWGRWPAESVVRYVMRFYGQLPLEQRHKIKMLDVGCGAGATAWFLLKEGFNVIAIDGSRTAAARTAQALDAEVAHAGSRVFVSRATQIELGPRGYDCVVDVCCLQYLSDDDLLIALGEVARVLKTGGRFFSRHSSDKCWAGIHTVAPGHNRSFSQLDHAYSRFFHTDLFHESVERRHPDHPGEIITVAHWLIEGVLK